MKRLALLTAGLALLAALLPSLPAQLLGLALAGATVLLAEPRSFPTRAVLRSLLVAVVAAGATGLAVAWTGSPARGAQVGVTVFLRILALLLVTTVAARRLDADHLHRLAARLRLPRVGLALGLALNSLPHLAETIRDAWIALAMRSRRRRPRLRHLPRLVEVLLAHTGRVAEEAAAAAALRGHSQLLRPLLGTIPVPPVVVVVGRSGTGKTPLLLRCATVLAERGYPLYGFVQPALTANGQKTGFEVLDLRTGRRAPLARRVGLERGQHATPFQFQGEGFALARAALAAGPSRALLVVDELGPVELRGGGHWPAVRWALSHRAPAALLIGMRRQLLAAFLAELGAEAVTVVDVEAGDAAEAAVLRAVAAAFSPGLELPAGGTRNVAGEPR